MPTITFTSAGADSQFNMTEWDLLSTTDTATVLTASPTTATFSFIDDDGKGTAEFTGFSLSGLTPNATPTSPSGTVTGVVVNLPTGDVVLMSGLNLPLGDVFAQPSLANGQALWAAITASDDSIMGGAGTDTLIGGGGNDTIDGGGGWNDAVYNGQSSFYTVTVNPDGSVTVSDRSIGSPDGTDHLTHIQELIFADGYDILGPTTATDAIALGFPSLLRETAPTAADQSLFSQLNSEASAGQLTVTQAIDAIIQQAENTSSVATTSYQFFTGSVPTTGGMDYLVSPTGPNANNLNSAYYQDFSLINRYINFAVNLGSGAGSGAAAFAQAHAAESLSQTLTEAYTTIFGTAPSAAKVDTLLMTQVSDGLGGTYARENYFAAYGGDGLNGVGTKAAMVGWLLAEAIVSNVGDYALTNDAFLTAVAEGKATFGVNMVGQYDQASFHYTGG